MGDFPTFLRGHTVFTKSSCLLLFPVLFNLFQIAPAVLPKLQSQLLWNIRLPNFPTSQLPDFRTFGLPDFRTSQLPDFPTSQLSNFRTFGLPDFRTSQLPDFRTFGLPDFPAYFTLT